MSGYLVTSPYGSLTYHKWDCDDCQAGGGGLSADREMVRMAASGHLRVTGHEVTVIDGTTESLYPMATEAARAAVTG